MFKSTKATKKTGDCNNVIFFTNVRYPWYEFKNTRNFEIFKLKPNFSIIKFYFIIKKMPCNSLFVFTDQLLRYVASYKINIINKLLKNKNYQSAFYFTDTLKFYQNWKLTKKSFWVLPKKFDYIFSYCQDDASKNGYIFLPLPFKLKKQGGTTNLKYDVCYVANALTIKRGQIIISLMKNNSFNNLNNFIYVTDMVMTFFKNSPNEKYFKYKYLNGRIAIDKYLTKSNVILFLKQDSDYISATIFNAYIMNKKILTDSRAVFDLTKEPNKVRYIEDITKFNKEDAKWCKEIDNTPYPQHVRDFYDETHFANRIIDAIHKSKL